MPVQASRWGQTMDCFAGNIDPIQSGLLAMPDWAFAKLHGSIKSCANMIVSVHEGLQLSVGMRHYALKTDYFRSLL